MKTLTLFAAGTAQGRKLTENARSMAAYSSEDLSIETITDFAAMASAGVHQLPAVAIDGKLVCQGRTPTIEELSDWISGATAA